MNKFDSSVCLEWRCWGRVRFNTHLGHVNLLFGRIKLICHTKVPYLSYYLSWTLAQQMLCWGLGGVLGWTLNPAETGWPGIFPDVEGFVLKLLPLPVGSLFKKKPHAGLDHRTGSVAMAPLWHTGVSHSSPGRAVVTEAKLPSVFSLTVRMCVCVHVYVCLSPSKPTCVGVCIPKSVQNCWQVPIPFVWLVFACVHSGLGLQAVVQD